MAFINEEEENPNGAQNPQNQQAPISSGGAGIGGANAAKPGVNVPAQPSAQLSSYLAANKPQAATFGQNIAQDLGSQITAAGQAIQPAVDTYTGSLYSVPSDPSVNAAVAASPSSLTADQKATYQKQLGAAGSSPNSASTFETTPGYQDAAGKIQKAVNTAGLWNSGNNVSSLTTALSPYEGANATAGDRALDSLLLSRTPEAYKKIQAAVAPAAGYQGQLDTATGAANDVLHSTIAQNQATTDSSQAAAKSYATNLNKTLAQYLTDAKKSVLDYNGKINPLAQNVANVQPQIAGLQDAVDAYNAGLSSKAGQPGGTWAGSYSGRFTPIELKQMGIIPSTIGMPDVAQLGTSGQYSDVAALRDLLGPDYFNSLNTSINPEGASLAGSWSPETNASIPGLATIIDPLSSSAIQGLIPNIAPANEINAVSPSLSVATPAVQQLLKVQNAIDALHASIGQQPFSGGINSTQNPSPPPPTATPPEPGQPASEAWYNYLRTTYPDLSGLPTTYQGYLDQYNQGGYHVL